MTCMLIGGDRPCKQVPKVLQNKGITRMKHWSGRKNLRGEPTNIALVVVLTGFAGHKVVRKAKTIAKKNRAEVVFLNKGLSRLERAVK